MRIVRHALNNGIRGAVLIVLSILLVGLIPIQAVFAASTEVGIPYRQTWSNESGDSVDNSFEYRLTAIDEAPLPDEAENGYYRIILTDNARGEIKLHFPFSKPGYYNYQVKAYIPERKADYSYDETTYDVMIMVSNADNGLGIAAMTIQDETQAKYPDLQFETAYTGGADNLNREAADGDEAANGAAEDEVTTVTIEDAETPQGLFTNPDNWALLNLILMILTLAVAFIDAVLYFRKPRDENGDKYEDEELKRHGLPRILAMVAGIGSLFLFIETEDITDPMIWVDEYTLWMLILFIAADILTVMSKKEIRQEDNESVT
jgi:hypothetical protein